MSGEGFDARGLLSTSSCCVEIQVGAEIGGSFLCIILYIQYHFMIIITPRYSGNQTEPLSGFEV